MEVVKTKEQLDFLFEERGRVLLKWQGLYARLGTRWDGCEDLRCVIVGQNEREEDRMKICVIAYNFALLVLFSLFCVYVRTSIVKLRVIHQSWQNLLVYIWKRLSGRLLHTPTPSFSLHLEPLLTLLKLWLMDKPMAFVTVLVQWFSNFFNWESEKNAFRIIFFQKPNSYLFPIFKW